MSDDPLFLTAKKAAAYVGISYSHFRALVAKGLLPQPDRRLGRKLWLREALDVWATRGILSNAQQGHDEIEWG